MARRSAVGHGREAAVVEEAPSGGLALGSPADSWEVPEQRAPRGGRWGGSGGRWWVWVGRAILWALILVILVNGIRAPFERFTSDQSGGTETPKPSKGVDFPTSSASAFAIQFATVYLNYDQRNAQARQTQLQSFVADGADGNFGWNGVGQLQVQSVQVAGVDVRDANNAVVTVLARATDRWFRLAVPVYTKNGAMVISSRPALLPPPTKAALPQSGVTDRDQALESELQSALGPFFQAYAQSDQSSLSRFADGNTITGLANSVTFDQVKEVVAPKGPANERTVSATVTWQIPGTGAGNDGGLDQTYELAMVKKGANWFVRDIHGTTRPGPS
jgi:hypothetical protein